jgi:hypothetical protein
MHYRIAVLESGDGRRVSAVHAKSDADDAALDTPWVRVLGVETRNVVHAASSLRRERGAVKLRLE